MEFQYLIFIFLMVDLAISKKTKRLVLHSDLDISSALHDLKKELNATKQENLAIQLQMAKENADLKTLLTQDNVALKAQIAQLNQILTTQMAQENVDLKAQIEKLNQTLTTQMVQEKADMKAQMTQLNQTLATQMVHENADLKAQMTQLNQTLTTQMAQENVNMKAQMTQLYQTLATQMAQENVDMKAQMTQLNQTLTTQMAQENVDLKAQMTQLNQTLTAQMTYENQLFKDQLTREDVALRAEVAQLRNSQGSTYVRWGRTVCAGNGTRKVYSGFTAGSYYDNPGGAASYVCLPETPSWAYYVDGVQQYGRINGAEYETIYDSIDQHAFGKSMQDQDAPCVVCHSSRAATIMIPGSTTCYSGWTQEYTGYLMTGDSIGGKAASDYACYDKDPEAVYHGEADKNGKLFYFTEAHCGSLPCQEYPQGRELACVVCSK